MKFPKLTIRNFMSIGEADLTLEDIGLVMILGENQDETSASSNGAGKSSIVDALSWALWGKTARGEAGDNVVNTSEGKNTCVEVELDDDGQFYRIERYRKHKKHKDGLFLFTRDDPAAEWKDISKGKAKDTQKDIERILGCSEEVFNAAVYSGQEAMPDIPRMTDRQLKTLVEQAAGVDVLTNAYEVARGRARECAETVAQAQFELDKVQTALDASKSSVVRLRDEKAQWDNNRTAHLDDLKRKAVEFAAEYKKAQGEFDREELAQIDQNITDTQAQIDAVQAEASRERELAHELNQAKSALSVARSRVEDQEAAVERQRKKLAQVASRVGTPCGECGKPYSEHDIGDAQKLAEEALQQNIDELAKLKAKIPIAEKLVQGANSALEKHRASMTDVSKATVMLTNLNRERQLLLNKRSEIAALANRARDAVEFYKRASAEENPYERLLKDATVKLLADKSRLDAAQKALEDAKQKHEYASAVVEVFAPAGVRARRLDEATPLLNQRTAHYLGSLADGAIEAFWTTLTVTKAGDLREQFSVQVEKKGSAPSFNSLSGGEKRKVRLACALALQDLVATRATKSIDLWVGDEIDDALDEAGLERLMGVLEQKARERGTVLVVSHNDIAHFASRTMNVIKKNGKAEVEFK